MPRVSLPSPGLNTVTMCSSNVRIPKLVGERATKNICRRGFKHFIFSPCIKVRGVGAKMCKLNGLAGTSFNKQVTCRMGS